MIPSLPQRLSALLLASSMLSCAAGPEAEESQGPRAGPTMSTGQGGAELVPAGLGTLRQDAITVPLRWGDLLIKTTPLEENVTRLTAPDTHQRLSGLVTAHREALERQAFTNDLALFLVSVFSYEANIPYTPEDLLLSSQGLRFRPLAIQPVTPGWNRRRLNQQETQMAIYAFDTGIDLAVDLVVQYQGTESGAWDAIIPTLQAERSKVRARGVTPRDTTSAERR